MILDRNGAIVVHDVKKYLLKKKLHICNNLTTQLKYHNPLPQIVNSESVRLGLEKDGLEAWTPRVPPRVPEIDFVSAPKKDAALQRPAYLPWNSTAILLT